MSADEEQNQRIRDLESRVNEVENSLSLIVGRLDTLTQIGKAIMLMAGAALGFDVIPMMGGV